MTKAEFTARLREKLSGLPEEDIEKSLEYYSEMISDREEEGLDEESAVAAAGTPDAIAEIILADTPLPKLIKEKMTPRRALRVWEIVLLIIGSPLWLTLAAAAGLVILSAYLVLWTAAAALYAAVLFLAVGAVCGIAAMISQFVLGNIVQGLFLFGLGLICAGSSILMFFASNAAAGHIAALGKRIFLGIKRCFIRKESKQ